MNKKNLIYIVMVGLISSFCLQFQSCKEDVIDTYSSSSGNALFFERYIGEFTDRVRIDTMDVSFSHYVGKDQVTFPFMIKLIGNILTEDKEYKVKAVEELTTAKEGQYTLPDKLIFRKGVATDSLYITIHRDKMAKDEEVVLTLALVANENFGLGYATYDKIKFSFNNKIVKPLWWIDTVELVFFGKYSYKKYTTIIEANPGFLTVEGLTQTEIREVALNTKDYIFFNNITEEDKSPMVIPVY